jgi:hypothetical protein
LALLFKLVNRVPNATNELKKIVEHHIYEMGINTIERVSGTAINVSLRLPFNWSVLQLSRPSYPQNRSSLPKSVLTGIGTASDWLWLIRLYGVSQTAHCLKLYGFLMNSESMEFS